MDYKFKRMFKGDFSLEESLSAKKEKLDDLHAASGFRETTTPYDQLRRDLKRVFPNYPDVFDYTSQGQDEE